MKANGFTLIELLIVVAIIAILAAIAIPNFLAAQIRAKVTRVRAEMRTLSTALESYYIDNNSYPLTTPWPGNTDPNEPQGVIPKQLSTPISYISNARLQDPFLLNGTLSSVSYYTYHNLLADNSNADFILTYGQWRMCSIGPDGSYWNTPPNDIPDCHYVMEYDPSNGTVSTGNIWRSQKHSEPFDWRITGCD